MKDAYVKFETAELLKEKGFDWFTYTYYTKDDVDEKPYFGMENLCPDNWNGQVGEVNDLWFSAPTKQMACKWLREEHNILVTVAPCEVGAGVDDYTYVIYEIQPEDYHFEFIDQGRMQPVAYTGDYEGTLEEGIKHVLTNLI